MKQPMIRQLKGRKTTLITNFGGVNEKNDAQNFEFVKMKNFCSDDFPSISVRPPRHFRYGVNDVTDAIPQKIEIEDDYRFFTGIASGLFYLAGQARMFDKPDMTFKNCRHSIIDMNGIILFFPEKYYYDYRAGGSEYVRRMERGLTNTKFVFENQGGVSKIKNVYIGGYFSKGDSIVIKNAGQNTTNLANSKWKPISSNDIVSVIVENTEFGAIVVKCYNNLGEEIEFPQTGEMDGVDVVTAVPDLSFACLHANRVWGTDESGEFIYASELGNPLSWNSFKGLTTDSWWAEVAGAGKFTGITAFQNHVIAFKENTAHEIYGDRPSNFAIPYAQNVGCTSGASIAEVNGALYFLGHGGVYKFTGGDARLVSENIKREFKDGVGGSFDGKYYLASGNTMLVFDTKKGLWHEEDNPGFVSFVNDRGKFYAVDSGDIYRFGGGEETIEFELETGKFIPPVLQRGNTHTAFIRLKADEKSEIEIYTKTDDNDFVYAGKIKTNEFTVERVPIRFRAGNSFSIKIRGKGNLRIDEIMYVQNYGGRSFGR